MKNANVRIFGFAAATSLGVLLAVLIGLGPAALLTVLILTIIEITFSFDNAIVNAKILDKLSPAWQTAFLTIGIIIAVFVVRLVLPIVIVALSAGLGFGNVVTLALNHPEQYADKLNLAHPLIASFGGAFLLALALDFFVNGSHEVHWFGGLEAGLKKLSNFWLPAVLAAFTVSALALAASDDARKILAAGWLGAAVFLCLKLLTSLLEKRQPTAKHLAGWAGLGLFIYLQILDASFSLDGVIGAFAITNDVLLIAAGLGIGALWVRSMTIFLVRRGTLSEYKFLEHGAFYTILILAVSMFASIFFNIPDITIGLAGVIVIGAAVISSVKFRKLAADPH